MAVFGVWVIGSTVWYAVQGTLPEATIMGAVGSGAILANGISLALLWAYRSGDANMRAVWLCTRNDVLGNVAVLLAAVGVFGTGTGWPDVVVAMLAMSGAVQILRHGAKDLLAVPAPAE